MRRPARPGPCSTPCLWTLTRPSGVANTEDNRKAYRDLLLSAPGLGQYISGAILFEETLFQARPPPPPAPPAR